MVSKIDILSKPTGPHWKTIGIHHHHGINVPLFSLRSAASCGIGEFTDLIPLIHWCKKIGMDLIQTLPLNDNGQSTSPYNAISAYALNPLHLGLSHLPNIRKIPNVHQRLEAIRELNKTQRIDYVRLHALRDPFLRDYYEYMGESLLHDAEFLQFVDRNPWLEGFALFKALKVYGQWQNWEMWSNSMQNPTQETFSRLLEEFRDEVNYHSVIQYLCFQQMEKVKQEASQNGVFIKGDIPILINRDSADVWQHRHLFQTHFSAGAPPDNYSPQGQNWGFPIYNWEAMQAHDYHWWKLRLEVASHLYHIYRIDHIVGFFRIWVIPPHLTGRDGWFVPEDKSKWIPQGENILQMMLKSSSMLPIGEDLGIVPDEVRTCLTQLGICGTKVMRWERLWNQGKFFIDPQNYPEMSMTTVSTHDSETLQLWWENNSDDARDFSNFKGWPPSNVLTHEHRYEILHDSLHSGSLFHINLLQEYLALIPDLTWKDPKDERINIPGTISNHNWSYRYLPSLEEITENEALSNIIKKLIG